MLGRSTSHSLRCPMSSASSAIQSVFLRGIEMQSDLRRSANSRHCGRARPHAVRKKGRAQGKPVGGARQRVLAREEHTLDGVTASGFAAPTGRLLAARGASTRRRPEASKFDYRLASPSA